MAHLKFVPGVEPSLDAYEKQAFFVNGYIRAIEDVAKDLGETTAEHLLRVVMENQLRTSHESAIRTRDYFLEKIDELKGREAENSVGDDPRL